MCAVCEGRHADLPHELLVCSITPLIPPVVQVQVQNIIHIHDARTRDAAAAADDEADTKCWACLFNSYYDPFPAATTAAAAAQLNGFT